MNPFYSVCSSPRGNRSMDILRACFLFLGTCIVLHTPLAAQWQNVSGTPLPPLRYLASYYDRAYGVDDSNSIYVMGQGGFGKYEMLKNNAAITCISERNDMLLGTDGDGVFKVNKSGGGSATQFGIFRGRVRYAASVAKNEAIILDERGYLYYARNDSTLILRDSAFHTFAPVGTTKICGAKVHKIVLSMDTCKTFVDVLDLGIDSCIQLQCVGSIVGALTGKGAVYLSLDSGIVWSNIYTRRNGENIISIAVPNTLEIGILLESQSGLRSIIVSRDSGKTWDERTLPYFQTSGASDRIISLGSYFYRMTLLLEKRGVFSFVNGGWQDIGSRMPVLSLQSDAPLKWKQIVEDRSGYRFALSDDGMIYFISNNDFRWKCESWTTNAATDMTYKRKGGLCTVGGKDAYCHLDDYKLEPDWKRGVDSLQAIRSAATESAMIVASHTGVYQTSDYGKTWQNITPDLQGTTISGLSNGTNKGFLMIAGNALWYYHDGWVMLQRPAGMIYTITHVALENDSVCYIAAWSGQGNTSRVFRSSSLGMIWEEVYLGNGHEGVINALFVNDASELLISTNSDLYKRDPTNGSLRSISGELSGAAFYATSDNNGHLLALTDRGVYLNEQESGSNRFSVRMDSVPHEFTLNQTKSGYLEKSDTIKVWVTNDGMKPLKAFTVEASIPIRPTITIPQPVVRIEQSLLPNQKSDCILIEVFPILPPGYAHSSLDITVTDDYGNSCVVHTGVLTPAFSRSGFTVSLTTNPDDSLWFKDVEADYQGVPSEHGAYRCIDFQAVVKNEGEFAQALKSATLATGQELAFECASGNTIQLDSAVVQPGDSLVLNWRVIPLGRIDTASWTATVTLDVVNMPDVSASANYTIGPREATDRLVLTSDTSTIGYNKADRLFYPDSLVFTAEYSNPTTRWDTISIALTSKKYTIYVNENYICNLAVPPGGSVSASWKVAAGFVMRDFGAHEICATAYSKLLRPAFTTHAIHTIEAVPEGGIPFQILCHSHVSTLTYDHVQKRYIDNPLQMRLQVVNTSQDVVKEIRVQVTHDTAVMTFDREIGVFTIDSAKPSSVFLDTIFNVTYKQLDSYENKCFRIEAVARNVRFLEYYKCISLGSKGFPRIICGSQFLWRDTLRYIDSLGGYEGQTSVHGNYNVVPYSISITNIGLVPSDSFKVVMLDNADWEPEVHEPYDRFIGELASNETVKVQWLIRPKMRGFSHWAPLTAYVMGGRVNHCECTDALYLLHNTVGIEPAMRMLDGFYIRSIYPNPAPVGKEQIVIEMFDSASIQSYQVHVYNSAGNVVASERIQSTMRTGAIGLNVSSYPSGIYYVVVSSSTNFDMKAFVKL